MHIIGFGGRMGSGKTELANILVENDNYIKFSFGDYLKETCAKLYDIPLEDFYNPQNKNAIIPGGFMWNENYACKLFESVNFTDYDDIMPKISKKFNTIRDMMQYIGTDVLRKHDRDFHVKKTIERLDPNKCYVCDDIRFENELKSIKQYGQTYCVIRPTAPKVSNHKSEVAVNWLQFDDVIINDTSLADFKNYFVGISKYHKRKDFTLYIEESTAFLFVDPLSAFMAGLILHNKHKLSTNVATNKTFLKVDLYMYKELIDMLCDYMYEGSSYVFENYSVYKILDNITKNTYHNTKDKQHFRLSITSPYVIENLKFWGLASEYNRSLISEAINTIYYNTAKI